MNRRSRKVESADVAGMETSSERSSTANPVAKHRLRERFRAETRHVILGAAEETLGKHGVRGARMEVIAAAAGIAVGTLYNYFADRQELIDALFEVRRRELIERLDAALTGAPTRPFPAQLEAFLGAGLTHFQAHRDFITLVLHDELSSEQGSRWSMMLELRERAERLVRAGIDAGLLRSDDRAMYPHLLMGLLKGVVEIALAAAPGEAPEALLAPAVRCFLEGARQHP
jgi:AcrR family transcriptional regulator